MAEPAPPDEPTRRFLASLTVLYVEDDATTRTLLGRFLRRRVGRLIEAADGAAGLEAFRAAAPAIVVTDIQMPRVDGLQMAAAIRALDLDVPIIVTTAHEQVDYLHRAIEVSVDRYVTKPVDPDKLERALLGCAARLEIADAERRSRATILDRLRAHEREALGLLAGGMAHDFNNLLQRIYGNIEVYLFSLPEGAPEREALVDALAASREASALGHELLTLSSTLYARFRVAPIALDLAALRAATGPGVVVTAAHPADAPPVRHDPALLARAFAQLAHNAGEAMAGSGALAITVAVRVLAEDEVPGLPPGRYLGVAFADDGPGIAAALLPRIFDPYFTTKPRGPTRGTGLGLAIVVAIVRKHGGAVTVDASVGGGATFMVLLPIEGGAGGIGDGGGGGGR